jgi:hypothetical protein
MADFLNYGEKRALLELDSIFKSQWKDGFLPHIRYVQEGKAYSPGADLWSANHNGLNTSPYYKTSSITQPPLVGYTFELCFRRSKNKAFFLAQLAKYIPKLHNYHKYLFENRNYKNCIYIIHPWESGLDNSPVFDLAGENAKKLLIQKNYKNLLTNRLDTQNVTTKERPSDKDYELYGLLMDYINKANISTKELPPFAFIDVVFNSIYIKSLISLKYILNQCKQHQIVIKEYNKISTETDKFLTLTLRGIVDNLYLNEDKCFYCFDIVSQKSIRLKTIHNFFPLILGKHISLKIENELFANFKAYSNDKNISLIPTNMDQETFSPYNYWRGPIWPIINWFFIEVFYTQKHLSLYSLLKKETIKLISEDFNQPVNKIKEFAYSMMEFNSCNHHFTTPSKQQYHHGWLWDSCFATLGWIHLEKANNNFYDMWNNIYTQRKTLKTKGYNEQKIKTLIRQEYQMPMFSEYYASTSGEDYLKNSPLGSDMMTWTASVFLDLILKDEDETN